MDRRLLAALVLPLVLAGCGDDAPSSSTTTESPASEGSPSGEPSGGSSGGSSSEDESAIEETILEFLLTGDCDLATDDYLRDLSLFADEDASREEACTDWENTFSKPLFTRDDVVLTELEVGDGVATVLVGSDIAPDITTLYQFTLVDGEWLVSGDEYNTDGL